MVETKNTENEPPFSIQRVAVPLALTAFIFASLFYLAQFSEAPFSKDPEQWGQLGDYLGGLVNPIVGLLTICLLANSLRQNQIALDQSRRELEMTKEAMQQVAAAQNSSESVLREQISIADQARDISNAVTIFNTYMELSRTSLDEHRRRSGDSAEVSLNASYNYATTAMKVEHIIHSEVERLKNRYPAPGQEVDNSLFSN